MPPHQTATAGTSLVRPTAGLLLAALISGLYWLPLSAVEARGVTALWVCIAIAALTLPVAAIASLKARRIRRGDLPALALIGLLVGGAFMLYTASLLLTDVVRALLLFYIAPAWGTLLEMLVMRRPLTLRRVLSLLLGGAGLVVILGASAALPLPQNSGDWLALISGMAWSLGALIAYRSGHVATADQTTAMAFGALAVAAALALLGIGGGAAPTSEALVAAAPWLVPLALLLTLPMWFLTLWAMRYLAPARTTLIFMAEVCVGVGSAAAFSGQPFGLREAMGTLLVLAAAAVELWRRPAAQSFGKGSPKRLQ